MDLVKLHDFETLSPFEIKDELIKLAKKTSRTTQSAFLNAGRGNPNWIATTPRAAFFLLGAFALEESKRVWHEPDIAGMPAATGIAARFEQFLAGRRRRAAAAHARIRRRTRIRPRCVRTRTRRRHHR